MADVCVCVWGGALCSVLTHQEKLHLANKEKIIGNEAFRAKDYEEAVAYYSRSGPSESSFISPSILLLKLSFAFTIKTDVNLRIGDEKQFVQQRALLYSKSLLLLITQC